jgi:hypothetical protein
VDVLQMPVKKQKEQPIVNEARLAILHVEPTLFTGIICKSKITILHFGLSEHSQNCFPYYYEWLFRTAKPLTTG